ncbi:MAG: NADH-quinone oxidoreductase subunit NuoG [Gammaproteobacteria bacterium]|nr:NADH-quinone oxidoreductase subunit NuoG [Gammaproteobacteria bacterium]
MAKIEIDGKNFDVENGKMIIEVADEAGIHIPRFCYHKKLSVAANCRMCLVEVEGGRKTVPACATPINDGMKVFTKSPAALRSQEAVMEFLLINHPLDCPICDQGGECELQDVSMGFGRDASNYSESKRAVADDDLGSLIATEMTRCIQCTRCVRFGEEVAGLPELGGIGRGEHMQISTYVQHSMTSEVSGNIIDLCPVGALTSKPYRFTARAWEMTQTPSIAPHDCLGSHLYYHTRRNHLMRVAPNEQNEINETWLSDRDRFSYLGLQHPARASAPRIKRDGVWETVDWQTALTFAASGIQKIIEQHGPGQFAAFASASSTLEELYLLQKAMRDQGVTNLDYRLQQVDFRDQTHQAVMPANTLPYAELEKQSQIFIVGCNVDREVPLAGLKLRKAFLNGAQIGALNVVDYEYRFDLAEKIVVSPQDLATELALILVSLAKKKSDLLKNEQRLTAGLKPNKKSKWIAQQLSLPNAVLVTGAICDNHPEAGLLRTLIAAISKYSGAKLIHFTTGANASGAALAGMLPHRAVAGKEIDEPGLDVQTALNEKLKGYLLMAVEPDFDFANPFAARQAMLAADHVVVLSAFDSEGLEDYADVILPIAPYAETSGTYVNMDGTWQSVTGAVAPHGEARPAWKVLRVLANTLHCDGFDYVSSQDVLAEVQRHHAMLHEPRSKTYYPKSMPTSESGLMRVGEWPLYRNDMIVRHADALQVCGAAEAAEIRVHSATADRLKLGEKATVSQGDIEVTLPLIRDDRIVKNTVWVANAMAETVDLGHAFGAITIK